MRKTLSGLRSPPEGAPASKVVRSKSRATFTQRFMYQLRPSPHAFALSAETAGSAKPTSNVSASTSSWSTRALSSQAPHLPFEGAKSSRGTTPL
jgi:hypothetical protein